MENRFIKQTGNFSFEIDTSYKKSMRVPAKIFCSKSMLDQIKEDKSIEQITNVASLPGIVSNALAMPDVHEGFGFPIGGVAAFDLDEGVISPGGIGYDINCGVRLLATNVLVDDIKNEIEIINNAIFNKIPVGVGSCGNLKIKGKDLDKILEQGAKRAVDIGFGSIEDLSNIESNGVMNDADSRYVFEDAKKRGQDQLGTLGAGNHFIEIEKVEKIFDEEAASRFGIFLGQAVILIHTGSRGLGHQIADDYIKLMLSSKETRLIDLPDRELSCAPFNSSIGREYFSAMSCAANFAWANRQVITHFIREIWQKIFGDKFGSLRVVYDIAHNIAKIEEYKFKGESRKLLIHRKGATRAFPNLPLIIPGSMGTGAYLLIGAEEAMKKTFGSASHGAGRVLSRSKAKKIFKANDLIKRMKEKNVALNFGSYSGLTEEAPEAYKDVDQVVEVIEGLGIAKKVARFSTVSVIKG